MREVIGLDYARSHWIRLCENHWIRLCEKSLD